MSLFIALTGLRARTSGLSGFLAGLLGIALTGRLGLGLLAALAGLRGRGRAIG